MFVSPDGLRDGDNTSYQGADHADDGASTLARASVGSRIFGDFPAAAQFHQAVSDAHSHHTTRAAHHAERLGVLGDKAHRAAADFDDMESANKDRLTLTRR